MLHRVRSVFSCIVLASTVCFGQSSFQEITPGLSTRADVARVFGRPVRSISPTIVEYAPPQGIAKVEVEYHNGSEIVERIEVYFARSLSRPALVQQFGLPQAADKKANAGGALVEFFGGASLLALTYESTEPSSGISHIAYYSRDLFEKVSGIRSGASVGKNPPGLNRPAAAATNPGTAQPLQPPTAKYEDLVARATSAMQASDFQTAVRLSQQAVNLDPNKPAAYEIVGIAQLYGMKDLGAAATAMRAAVQHGGSASFSVSHDHDGFFQTYCQGSLYVTNYAVNYRSNDGAHSFIFNRTDLKEIGLNSFVGANFHSFHIKVNQNNRTRNYNFAPGTLSADESNLILQLLKNP